MNHTIVMDSREPIEVMTPLLQDAGFTVQIATIPVGDYIIDDKLVFSLKSYNDFFNSVKSNHLHNEITEMLGLPDRYFIALAVWRKETGVEFTWGHNRKSVKGGLHKAVKDRIATLNAFYLPVFEVQERKDVVELMRRWAEKAKDEEFPYQVRRRVEVVKVNAPQTLKLYLTFPGVGAKNAQKLYEKFPTIGELLVHIEDSGYYDKERWGSKQKWMKAAWFAGTGIGEKRALQITEALL